MYGWRGLAATSRAAPVLDDATRVEHGDLVGDLGHHGEIVRDVDERDPEVVPDTPDLGEHPCLRDHVEARRGLVEDDDRRLAGERGRDCDALLLAARELVRVAAPEALVGQAARPHSAGCPPLPAAR